MVAHQRLNSGHEMHFGIVPGAPHYSQLPEPSSAQKTLPTAASLVAMQEALDGMKGLGVTFFSTPKAAEQAIGAGKNDNTTGFVPPKKQFAVSAPAATC